MPDWNDIFTKNGKVFLEAHPDMKRIASLFKQKKLNRILDLGCGTGRHLILLSKMGFEVYGIDASPKALEVSRQWLEEEGMYANLQLNRIEHRFPFGDNIFNAVISIQVIHHNLLKDIIFTIKEIERVLKRNGYIFITFPILKGGGRIDEWELKEIEKGTYIPLTGPEKDLPHHFFTLEEINDLFSSFNLIEIYIDETKHRAILGVKK